MTKQQDTDALHQAWQRKPVLRAIYHDYYRRLLAKLRPGRTLEIGGGTGNLKDYAQDVITSDIQPAAWLDVVADAEILPFADASFDNVVMVDVLHHVARPLVALQEINRVLKTGGHFVLLEPGVSVASGFANRYHHERCDPRADVFSGGPMCDPSKPWDANLAVPTLLFRDGGARLAKAVSGLTLIHRQWLSTFVYPLSGGFQPWCLIPVALVRPLLWLDALIARIAGPIMGFRLFVVMVKGADASAVG
jgi:SAM-dependent methyltransferase